MNGIVLSAALRANLASLNNTQKNVNLIFERLSSGLKINSALDNPQNFFKAQGYRHQATDYRRVADQIQQNIFAVQQSLNGANSITALIDQARVVLEKSRAFLELGQTDPALLEVGGTTTISVPNPTAQTVDDVILASTPVVYYRLNETSGPIIDSGSSGPVNATRQNGALPGAPALYTHGAQPSVQFDGVNDRITVSNSSLINTSATPARTVELVFNADTTAGRQVLYEEGATVNGFTIYIDNGLLRVEAEDDGAFGNLDISEPIVAGQTYHVAFTYSGAANTFRGYLNGAAFTGGADSGVNNIPGPATFPSHSGAISIGGINSGVQFHDGEDGAASGYNFQGRISNVAIYNRVLNTTELQSRSNLFNVPTIDQEIDTTRLLNREYENLKNEINNIVADSRYQSSNLLAGRDLLTNFNPSGSSFLLTDADDLTTQGLNILDVDFESLESIEQALDNLEDARKQVQTFSSSLVLDIALMTTRLDFAESKIKNLIGGAEDLTVADQNEEGAKALALLTRQQLGLQSLSLASQFQRAVLGLF